MAIKHNRENCIPLFNHALDAESVFTPQALIEAVRTERGMTSGRSACRLHPGV
jgi:hypothetical protein